MSGDPTRHLPVLDGVRGLAILLVLVIHLGVMIPQTGVEHALFAVISSGWIGVELFFVLSGFLITGILLASRDKPNYFRNFYIRRVLRIFPLYYGLLIFSLYLLPMIPHPKAENFARVAGNEIWYWLFVQNFYMAQAGGPQHSIMDVTWSLAIEEQFYIVWPLMVFLVQGRRLLWACLGLIVFSIAFRVGLLSTGFAPWTVYVVTPGRIDGLCVGAIIAVLVRNPEYSPVPLATLGRWAVGIGGLATIGLFALEGGLHWDRYSIQTVGYTAFAVLFGGMLTLAYIGMPSRERLSRVFSTPFLTILGVYSYSLYLFHLPIRGAIRDFVWKPEAFPNWFGGTLVAQSVFYVVAGALALAAAAASYHLYEMRFLALKDRLAPSRPSVKA